MRLASSKSFTALRGACSISQRVFPGHRIVCNLAERVPPTSTDCVQDCPLGKLTPGTERLRTAVLVSQIRHQARVYATAAPPAQTRLGSKGTAAKPSWEIRMLYDGECPLCMREVNMLRRKDEGVGKIDFVDISSPEYSPEKNANLSYEQAMGEIHAILPDGSVVKNIEVFRRLYEAVGLGWVYAITKVQPIGAAANWLYGIWAKYRLPVTGRPDLATVLAEKKSCKVR